MSRIDEIIARQRELDKELEVAKQEERESVLEDIKAKIRLFGFKTTDFKGVLATRAKRSDKALSGTIIKRPRKKAE